MDSLTLMDRGDCCPAQARVLVGRNDLRLMFCRHHYAFHEDALLTSGWDVIIMNDMGLGDKVGVETR